SPSSVRPRGTPIWTYSQRDFRHRQFLRGCISVIIRLARGPWSAAAEFCQPSCCGPHVTKSQLLGSPSHTPPARGGFPCVGRRGRLACWCRSLYRSATASEFLLLPLGALRVQPCLSFLVAMLSRTLDSKSLFSI